MVYINIMDQFVCISYDFSTLGSDWFLGSPAVANGYVGSPGVYYVGSRSV